MANLDALACLFEFKLTSYNFFKFFEKRLRQFLAILVIRWPPSWPILTLFSAFAL